MRWLTLLLLLLSACYTRPIGGRGDDDSSGDDDSASDDDASDDDAADDDSFPDDDDASDDDAGDDDTAPACTDGETSCFGLDHRICEDGVWVVQATCTGATPLCDPNLGCVACAPSTRFCDNTTVRECDAVGGSSVMIEDCAPDACVGGVCVDACTQAETQYSYLGCHFLAASTSNIVDAGFDNDFAVVVGNPSTTRTAAVTVTRGGSTVASASVPPGQTAALTLAMVPELRAAQQTAIAVDGAYEVQTDTPVVAYQYSPLHFQAGGSYSYTNDASLLLPEHVLTGNYMASTWPTWGRGSWQDLFGFPTGGWDAWYPGFVAVAATTDNTSVTVTAAGFTHGGAVTALAPGQSATVTLNRGDVLQLFGQRPDTDEAWGYCNAQGWSASSQSCPPSGGFPPSECQVWCGADDTDLTGTTVVASSPVAVWAGHMCTFIPYDRGYCDHLEEMMFPQETWGVRSVLTAPVHPQGSGVAAARYRVLALTDGTQLSFTPAVFPASSLFAGQFVEFETNQDFVIEGTGRFYATQTMQGQEQLGDVGGDPAMGSGIPWAQARNDYDFLTPDTYTANYVNIVAETGTSVTLDGAAVSSFQAIGSTGFQVARVTVSPGSHRIVATGGRAGITTYGYASYTSYLLPGGLNFTR